MTKTCPHCQGPMSHKKDYRVTPWNVSNMPSQLWELWVCMDCEKQKSVHVPADGSIEQNQRGRALLLRNIRRHKSLGDE